MHLNFRFYSPLEAGLEGCNIYGADGAESDVPHIGDHGSSSVVSGGIVNRYLSYHQNIFSLIHKTNLNPQ